jgi:hypothetical protein
MECLIKTETDKTAGKMELLEITRQLMPAGKPAFLEVVKYPMIRVLAEQHGRKLLMAVLVMAVKDFCASLNVVRNMNEDQMIEAAAMLLDECGNFRLEDYVMMFTMAKRGQLIKIYDRLDLQVIGLMMDEYWCRRKAVADAMIEDEVNHYDSLGQVQHSIEDMPPEQAKMIGAIEGITAGFSAFSTGLKENKALSEDEARKQIKVNPNFKNPYQKPIN